MLGPSHELPSDGFSRFNYLPPEIRFLIWEYALDDLAPRLQPLSRPDATPIHRGTAALPFLQHENFIAACEIHVVLNPVGDPCRKSRLPGSSHKIQSVHGLAVPLFMDLSASRGTFGDLSERGRPAKTLAAVRKEKSPPKNTARRSRNQRSVGAVAGCRLQVAG